MTSTFRSIWLLLVGLLTFPPLLAPWPWLGCVGGFFKLVGYMTAGPLYLIHVSLVLLYGSLAMTRMVSGLTLRLPVLLSSVAVLAIVVTSSLTLLTCSPQWSDDPNIQTNSDSLAMTSVQRLIRPAGVSLSRWTRPVDFCLPLELYDKNITTIYRDNLPPVGPHSMDPVHLNPVTKLAFAAMGNHRQTKLHTTFYPLPEAFQNQQQKEEQSSNSPGLVIFVHGGGWWTGNPTDPASPCVGHFAFLRQYHYAVVEYRLQRNGWAGDVQLQDVKEAIRHIFEEHGEEIDQKKVIIVGYSAGGHLGLLASYQINKEAANDAVAGQSDENTVQIAGVVAVAPSTSIEIGTGSYANPGWSAAWKEAEGHQRLCQGVDDCHQKLSPIEHVSHQSPRTILMHGAHDEYYNPHHSRALADKLNEYHVPCVHIEPPLMPHCLDLLENSIPMQMVWHATTELMQSLG